jgi:3-oxoacyl-[acyl-carrier-protein] synthase III
MDKDREPLLAAVDDFEKVMTKETKPQKKDLLRRLVKKVRVRDRGTAEVRWGLPHQTSIRTTEHMTPRAGLEPATNRLTADRSTD